ncbi:MAG: hypothetical protein DRN78_05520 [Thermoproteota archaeon]|nr:MAG: hypothetical protein DRN78_05520 [Candidatus Korarchaeota archaeon]
MDLAGRYEIAKVILISPHQRITLNRYILQNSEDELVRWKNHVGGNGASWFLPPRMPKFVHHYFLYSGPLV